MTPKLHIIIGDTGDSFAVITADAVRRLGEWAVTRPQTEAILHTALEEHPDAILLNITNLEMDYAALAQHCRQLTNTAVFAVLHTQNLFLENVLRRAGVHCRHLPLEEKVLIADIRSCMRKRTAERFQVSENRPHNAIADLLLAVGIPMHLQGFQCLRIAILKALHLPSLQSGWVMREIYPAVAEELGSTAVRVERSIRSAILRTWETAGENPKPQIDILINHRMTNSEFILYAVNYLRTEYAEYDRSCG